jgi:hypothetical protein
MPAKIKFSGGFDGDESYEQFKAKYATQNGAPIARAMKSAITKASDQSKLRGRKQIVASGLGERFGNALKVEKYLNQTDPAGWLHWDSSYAAIFETGGVIVPKAGRNWLWLPMKNAPRGIKRPSDIGINAKNFVKLNRGPFKAPLLGTQLILGNRAKKSVFGLQAIRNKASHDIAGKLRPVKKGNSLRVLPLFIGINKAKIEKRVDLLAIAQSEMDNIGNYYFDAINNDKDVD